MQSMRMNTKHRASSDIKSDEDLCVLCFRSVRIYSIGYCNHAVCFECSTRMRVLCSTFECPICRKELSKVIFVSKPVPYSEIDTNNMNYDARQGIYFEFPWIMADYDQLLGHECHECGVECENFNQLKVHMTKSHELFFCDLCVSHLKIFTFERKYYSRTLLATHRRKGDSDDTSHKGHPLCEFCDARYMDRDELFRHLRKDHYYCHFCDADGSQKYYDDYTDLRKHFADSHFLCELEGCAQEKFTSVYRTRLDLKAHWNSVHSHTLSKEEARQVRTVDISFTLNQRQPAYGNRPRRPRKPEDDVEEQEAAAAQLPPSAAPEQQQVDITCDENFPTLGGKTSSSSGSSNLTIAQKVAYQNRLSIRAGGGLSETDFPTLAPSSSTTSVHVSVNTNASNRPFSSAANICSQNLQPRRVVSIPNQNLQPKKKPQVKSISHSSNITLTPSGGNMGNNSEMSMGNKDFPSLCPSSLNHVQNDGWSKVKEKPKKQENKTSSVSNNSQAKKLTKNTTNDFPMLSSRSSKGGESAPTWVKPKPVEKMKKQEPPKKKSEPLNASDFPSLKPSKNHLDYSGRSSVTVPLQKRSDALTDALSSLAVNEKVIYSNNVDTESKQKNDKSGAKGNAKAKNEKSNKPKKTQKFPVYEYDGNGPREDFSMGRLGDYVSVAPQTKSNISVFKPEDTIKKSELNVGTLSPSFATGDFPSLSGSNNDFPSLSGSNNDFPSLSGSNNISQDFNSNWSKNSIKNKKSQKENIPKPTVTQNSDEPPKFSFPNEFQQRNNALFSNVQNLCEFDLGKINRFKNLAKELRIGTVDYGTYYSQCKEVLGKDDFLSIFPELLALLPDINLQQGILEAYNISDSKGRPRMFKVCNTCRQVLLPNDFQEHLIIHPITSKNKGKK